MPVIMPNVRLIRPFHPGDGHDFVPLYFFVRAQGFIEAGVTVQTAHPDEFLILDLQDYPVNSRLRRSDTRWLF